MVSFKTCNDANFSGTFPKLATTQWIVRRWARQDDKLVRFPSSIRKVIDLLDVYGAIRGVNLDIHNPMRERRFRRPKDNFFA